MKQKNKILCEECQSIKIKWICPHCNSKFCAKCANDNYPPVCPNCEAIANIPILEPIKKEKRGKRK